MTQATITTLDPLKTRHREIWAKGDYPSVATNVIASLGPVLVEAAGIQRHTRVLDVAAGSGNVALPAARLGAEVVASDLTPALLAEGKRQAIAEGLDLDWREGDAEDLPFASNAFDIVTSCVGVMFAPHHQASADELVRVTRPGGTIGLLSWTPSGFIGQMFATMKPFQAPPPPGVQPPPLWGDEQHVRTLFGDRVNFTSVSRQVLDVTCFDSADAFLTFFKQAYGPTIAAYEGLASDQARVNELDDALIALANRFNIGGSTFRMQWEYLLTVATKQ